MDCSFCGTKIPKGTGIKFIKKDGTTYNFCSKKCEKNQLKLKRKSANVLWTKRAQQLKKVALKAAQEKKTKTKSKAKKSAKPKPASSKAKKTQSKKEEKK